MKCLSVRQPWASLIASGQKDVENRTWRTHYRGPLLIHAAKTPVKGGPGVKSCGLGKCLECRQPDCVCLALDALDESGCSYPLGAILGKSDLIDCVQHHPSPWAEPGAWHWVLANPRAFLNPIPYKGRLGLFEALEAVLSVGGSR